MSLRAVALVPSAPLLIPGVWTTMPPELDEAASALGETVASLPSAAPLLLLAAACGGVASGWYADQRVDLGGLSRADAAVDVAPWTEGQRRLAEPLAALGLSPHSGAWPVDLAALVLQARAAGHGGPVMALLLPWRDAAALDEVASLLVAAGQDAVLLAAADLSAGLSAKAPRHELDGAAAWDEAVQAALRASGEAAADQLAQLGPGQAQRVACRSWPAVYVAVRAAAQAGLALHVRHYSAPRGVGYLVARS